MNEGKIKKIADRGFGFIETVDGNDLFFHSSSVEGARFEDLRVGQKVTYRQGSGPKGPCAEHVQVA